MPDVFKILKDLELRAVGLDSQTMKMQEGYFSAFRSVGLPIRKEDYRDPWSPLGQSHVPAPPESTATDPQTTAANPPTTSSTLASKQAQIDAVSQSMRSFVNAFILIDDKLVMDSQYSVMPSSSQLSNSWYAIINGAEGIPSAGGG